MEKRLSKNKKLKAYVVGLALGDGNLSNPNGRAVRLRITCDKKYPKLIQHIQSSVQKLLPDNQVAIVNHKGYIDISCYSNKLESILGWKAKGGSKYKQNVSVPHWIKRNKTLIKECLRGLLQTDGSIYYDRGYLMVNFVNHTPALSNDVFLLIQKLGFKPNIQKLRNKNGSIKHTIRISKNAAGLLADTNSARSPFFFDLSHNFSYNIFGIRFANFELNAAKEKLKTRLHQLC